MGLAALMVIISRTELQEAGMGVWATGLY